MLFLLVHSPLAGPYTWELTAAELGGMGHTVVVPALTSPAGVREPYWRGHVDAVARALGDEDDALEAAPEEPPVLAGHSGAGPLLPLIGRECRVPPAAYVFVDAALPTGGRSRLEAFPDQGVAELSGGQRLAESCRRGRRRFSRVRWVTRDGESGLRRNRDTCRWR